MTDATVSVIIPFGGFYESLWSSEIDRQETSFAEYEADERQCNADYYPDDYQPAHLRLDQGEIADILYRVTQYRDCYSAVARAYVSGFDDMCAEELGTPLDSFTFEAMSSPREYNFTTDRLFCDVPLDVMQGLRDRTDPALLAQQFASAFTSRDGFRSFYSPIVPDKPLEDWDHNELAQLLVAALHGLEDIDFRVYENVPDSLHSQWQEGVDWTAYQVAVDDLRAEKAEKWALEHPTEAPPYRCPVTTDLFAHA